MKNRLLLIPVLLVLVLVGSVIVQVSFQRVESFPEVPRCGDVAVIGGTTAALIAAQVASEHGAQVYLFPQGQEIGNDSVYLVQEGLATWKSPAQQTWQEEQGQEIGNGDEEAGQYVEMTREAFQRALLNRGEGMNEPFLLQHFLKEAPEFHRWMQDYGVNFDLIPHPEQRPFWLQTSSNQGGLVFRRQLVDKLKQSNVLIQEENVVSIKPSEDENQVVAVKVENHEQDQVEPFYFQSVVLADGGYSGDLQSWKEYLPQRNLVSLRADQKGRGLQMAAELEAEIVQTSFFNRRMALFAPEEEKLELLPRNYWENAFLVNRDGQTLDISQASSSEAFSFIVNAPSEGVFITAPEEKAHLMQPFITALDNWAEAVETGRMEQAPQLQLEPPVFLAQIKAGVDFTLGGLSVTPQGEVKRRGGIIEGLFAAGEIAGGLHGEAMLEGMPLSETIFLGRSAGRAAAEYARR